MIFLILVAFIAVIVVGLNMYDNSNLQSIENYLQNKKCQEIVYSKGTYKGLCDEGMYLIPNSFSLKIEEDKKIALYQEITSITKKAHTLTIHTSKEDFHAEFKDEKRLNHYMQQLQDKY